MNDLLMKLVNGENITDMDIAEELYEVCDREHSSCNSDCPVFKKNGNKPVNADRPFDENRGCDCFKNGSAMLKFLRSGK